MKLSIGLIFCLLVLGVDGHAKGERSIFSFLKEAGQGTSDMLRAYFDMREANYIGADKYFHARGNYDAAQRGPGGVWAAKVLSNAGKYLQGISNRFYYGMSNYGSENIESNQKAEEWGRYGKDPNHFRPPGLPEKY